MAVNRIKLQRLNHGFGKSQETYNTNHEKILSKIKEMSVITINNVKKECKVTRITAIKHLNGLVKEKKLTMIQEGNLKIFLFI